MSLEVGDTLLMNAAPNSQVSLMCGDAALTEGQIGRIGNKIAMRVERGLSDRAKKLLLEEGDL